MQRARVGLISFLLAGVILATMAFTNAAPPMATALIEGRTYDQAHDVGYIDWSGSVQYVYLTHRDSTALPPEEGGIPCDSGCSEWVTRLGSGGSASGAFDRNVSYFEVLVSFSHDSSVGNATLRACSAVQTWDLYSGPGGGLPGFISMTLSVPAGCRSWSLSASSGYVDFRSIDVTYSTPPATATYTATLVPSLTPTMTRTPTLTATSTLTLTPTYTTTPSATSTPSQTPTSTPTFTPTNTSTPTPTNTPSPTPTPLPPGITGQIKCDIWGDAGWCRGNESLELTASDPQAFDFMINGDLNGIPFSCASSCSIPLPEGIGTANYVVTSTSGRTASGSSTWQRDSTPPVLNIVVPSVDGRNEWYVSDVDFTANASDAISGLVSVAGSIDNGVTWNSFPIHLVDGVYSVAAYARDIAGNEVIKTTVIRIDTVPPVSQITSHANGQVLQGNVTVGGKLEDLTSGAANGELSLDGGTTWQIVSLDAANTWSFAWNTAEVPNDQYELQVRGIDQAGNVGNAASITIVIDNRAPRVALTDRWWIWESGQLKISPNYFPIASVKVIISDPQYRWPEVVLNFDPEKIPASISWDRRFPDGTLAPSGWYRVVAIACDTHDLCGSDEGIIEIPLVTTPTITLTLSPAVTVTATPQASPTATQNPTTATPGIAAPTPEVAPEPTKPIRSIPFWQILGLLGLFLAIASAGVIDPRPAAIDRLKECMNLVFNQRKDFSDDNE